MPLQVHADRDAAIRITASAIVDALTDRLGRDETATIAVCGGSTPGPVFDRLARSRVDWSRVRVVPTDERLVPADHDERNARLIRERLLVRDAAPATLIDIEEVAFDDPPFAAVLLGMGEDGHVASLFPDASNLEAGLDLKTTTPAIDVTTTASEHRRRSLTLARLLNTDVLRMLVFGDAKRQRVRAPEDTPYARLLDAAGTRLRIVWAP